MCINLNTLSFLLKHTSEKKGEKKSLQKMKALWSHLGSNQGPPDYESDALTS